MACSIYVIGNYLSGAKEFVEVLHSCGYSHVIEKTLEVRAYSEQEILSFLLSNKGGRVLHIVDNYEGLLNRLALCHEGEKTQKKLGVKALLKTLDSFYKNDRLLMHLGEKLPHIQLLHKQEVCKDPSSICQWIDPSLCPRSLKKKLDELSTPYGSAEILKSKSVQRELEEKTRLLQVFRKKKYVSDRAFEEMIKTLHGEDTIPLIFEELPFQEEKSLVCVDCKIPEVFIHRFFTHSQANLIQNSLLVVFSVYPTVRDFFEADVYQQYLESGALKLWHVSEWEHKLCEELKDYRSSFWSCEAIFSPENKEVGKKIKIYLQKSLHLFLQKVRQSEQIMKDYYQGEKFVTRLEEIKGGRTLRVYFSRACSAIAVKKFTDGCIQAFQNLGCEVFAHRPCKGGKIDYELADLVEMAAFLPDLYIRSPNKHPFPEDRFDALGIPTLISLQDITPHREYEKINREHPLKPFDFLYILMDSFYQKYLLKGISKKKIIKAPLPIPSVYLKEKTKKQEDLYEVAFVKTLSVSLDFSKRVVLATHKEKARALQIEKEIEDCITKNQMPSLEQCFEWGQSLEWGQRIIDCLHQKFCLHHVKSLYNRGVQMNLYGSHWDRHKELAPFSRGHIEDPLLYQKIFWEHKIHLSINAWSIYHPRIFEGGVLGAFFLVYHPPRELCEMNLPEGIEVGVHYDSFSSTEEMIDKCQFYLSRPKLRKEMGSCLQEFVSHYSYENFCKQLKDEFYSAISLKEVGP